MITHNGGPAFPRVVATQTIAETGAITAQEIHPGMSLRDWFAGQALAGLLATAATDEMTIPNITRMAFESADAMLAAREGRS